MEEETGDNFSINSVYPKVFTPSGVSPYNSLQIVFEEKWESIVSGKIFDLSGAHVADLAQGIFESSLSWDGKFNDGRDANSGVYIYMLSVPGGQKVTGTVVLAR